jgi:hypothetical protein
MITQFKEYLTFENIYLWTNFGVLPFWLMLMFLPNSKFTQFFINSIILPLILAICYIFIINQIYLLDDPIYDIFKIYISLDGLYTAFSTDSFLLLFWLHFISINLFLGSWIARDGVKYVIPKGLVFIPLILVYLTGPVGLVFYWFVRIFYSKKLGFHD